MRKIREVLRLRWEQGLSHRQIVQSCGIGGGSVVDYLRRAQAAGISWPLPEGLSEADLEARLFPPPAGTGAAAPRSLPDWSAVHRELRKKGVTLLLLWEEHRSSQPNAPGYSRFCELYQQWRGAAEPRMHQVHKAGEKLFVDYAGQTMPVIDPTTRESGTAQIFVATWGASSYTYAEATWTQSLPDWIGSHVRAFAYFGGVPELLVPDNLKSGVTSPCYYEPDINPTYQELACHYGTVVLPARVRRPRDNGKVENGVLQVEQRVLAPLRNCTFFSLTALNDALREPLTALNDRPGQGLPESRRALFETLDQPALRPLPADPFEIAEWAKARVHLDYHIQVDYHHYSVPYRLLRQQVEVRLTTALLEVYLRGERVASHCRSDVRYGYTTLPEHMPPGHRAYAERDPAGLLERARHCGTATAEFCLRIQASRPHPEQGYRGCLGVLRLGDDHGAVRLERACARALRTGAASYHSVAAILKHHLEAEPLPEPRPAPAPIQHENIRGAEYYGRPEETLPC